MTIREVKNNDFSNEIKVFDGLRDLWGKKFFVLVNNDLNEIRLVAKNAEFGSKKRALAARKLNHVIPQKYLEVIDLTKEVATFLEREFPHFKHTEWQIW